MQVEKDALDIGIITKPVYFAFNDDNCLMGFRFVAFAIRMVTPRGCSTGCGTAGERYEGFVRWDESSYVASKRSSGRVARSET